MIGKNNKKLQAQQDADKIIKYSLRKMKVRGAASVAIAAFFLLGGTSVAKAEEGLAEQPVTSLNDALTEDEADPLPVETAETSNSDSAETAPLTEEKQPTVKLFLEKKVKELKELDKSGKTEESVKQLEELIKKAEELLADESATQEQVDKAVLDLQKAELELVDKAEVVADETKTETEKAETPTENVSSTAT